MANGSVWNVKAVLDALSNQPEYSRAIDVNDCTSVYQIYERLINKANSIGTGYVGKLQDSNLKTLLGGIPTDVGNYVQACIRIVSFGGNQSAVMEVVLCLNSDGYSNIARKYLWVNGASHNESQSEWETIQRLT